MNLVIKLVRHGQSNGNIGLVKSWEVGDPSIELTARGHEQARNAGVAIGRSYQEGALFFCSPFVRTRQTLTGLLYGAGLSRAEARVYEDPRLREVEHGYFDVPEQEPLKQTHGRFYYRFHGGESPADCYDRTSGFLEGMMRQVTRRSADRIVIVTHGLTIRCFVMRFLHLTVEQFESLANPGNCDVITLAPRDSIPDPLFLTSRWAVSGLRLREGEEGGVSRESARTIAARVITEQSLGIGVGEVFHFDELVSRPVVYGDYDMSRCWVAYATRRDRHDRVGGGGNIVLVDRYDGSVAYAGRTSGE